MVMKTKNEIVITNRPQKTSLKWILFGFAILGVLITISAFSVYYAQFNGGLSAGHDKWGTFGDFIGGSTGPLLALLSLIAILFTIYQQQEELRFSQIELIKSVGAAKSSAKAAQTQVSHLQIQAQKDDLLKLIQQIDTQLEDFFNAPIYEIEGDLEGIMKKTLPLMYQVGGGTITFRYVFEVELSVFKNIKDGLPKYSLSFDLIRNGLNHLFLYMKKLESLSERSDFMTSYFKYKYRKTAKCYWSVQEIHQQVVDFFIEDQNFKDEIAKIESM
jgi:hypothetical protein